MYRSAPVAIFINAAEFKNNCLAQNINLYKFQ